MKIKMLRTMFVYPEPHNVLDKPTGYMDGQEYEVDELHAKQWCHVGISTAVEPTETEQ